MLHPLSINSNWIQLGFKCVTSSSSSSHHGWAHITKLQHSHNLAFNDSDLFTSHHFGLKLLIKMHRNNYFLWNQQVKSVILVYRVQKVVVNPHIPLKFKTVQEQLEGKISDECETWIVQDYTIFTWLLSTILEFMLLHRLCCKHTFDICDKIHNS